MALESIFCLSRPNQTLVHFFLCSSKLLASNSIFLDVLNLLCSSIALIKEVLRILEKSFSSAKLYFLDIYSHSPLTRGKHTASKKGVTI
jgi:hypothetical protein